MKSMTYDRSTIMSDSNNNSSSSSMSGASTNKKSNEKYSLRQRQKRDTTRSSATFKDIGDHDEGGRTKEKSKPKAAPLSKYRRKTANARERTRMREINSAFENLRSCVPHSISGGEQTPTNEKLTKITTLRLAMKYIRTLSEALTIPDYDTSFLFGSNSNDTTISNNNNNNNNINNNNNHHTSNNNLQDIDAIFRTTIPATNLTSKIRISGATTTKSSSQNRSRQKTKQKLLSSETLSSSSMSSSPAMDENPTDLGLLLESDGESLHLSEPCLSPLGHNMKPFGCTPTDSPLELAMFLESDSESLQFSEPCLSPLGTLDSFNPFGDLLHTEFSEQTSLDIYLT